MVFLQILPAGASKGKGVDQLLKHLNVQPERVLAMGDGENDKVMLQVLSLLVASLTSKSPAVLVNLWLTCCYCFPPSLAYTCPAPLAAKAC